MANEFSTAFGPAFGVVGGDPPTNVNLVKVITGTTVRDVTRTLTMQFERAAMILSLVIRAQHNFCSTLYDNIYIRGKYSASK